MQIKTLKFLTLLSVAVASVNLSAQTKWIWARQGMGTAYTEGITVTTDKNDNAYFSGYYQPAPGQSVIFGADTLQSNIYQVSFLVKYDSAGNVLWATQNSGNNSSSTIPTSIATDRNNNVYETGYFSDTVLFGTHKIYSQNYNMYLVKYNASGNPIWAFAPIAKSSYDNAGNSVAIDTDNNIYVTGIFEDTAIFGIDTIVFTSGAANIFLAKYDPNGNVLWVEAFGNNNIGGSNSLGVTVDGTNCPIIVGDYRDLSISFGTHTLVNSGNANIFLTKLSPNGSTIWAISDKGTQSDAGYCVTTDKDNDIYISGLYSSPMAIFGKDTLRILNGPLFVAKYDSGGNEKWAKAGQWVSNSSAMATDLCNDVYIAGEANYSDSMKIDNVILRSPLYSTDPAYIIELDSAGNYLNGTLTQTGGDDWNGIAINSKDDIYFGGDVQMTVFFGDTVYLTNPENGFISKLTFGPVIIRSNKSGDSSSICSGDSITLKIVYSNGTTYKWNTGATIDSITVKPLVTTTYYAIIDMGCSIDTSYIKIKVTPINASILGKGSICKGDTVLLSGKGGITYLWSTSQTNDSIKVVPLSNTTYTLTAFNGACKKDTTYKINVVPLANPVISGSSSNCVGFQDNLTVSGGTRYKWSNGSTSTSYKTSPINADTIISVIVYNSLGCSDTGYFPIKVFPSPTVTVTHGNGCVNTPVIIKANTSGSGPFIYSWSPGGMTNDSIIVNDSAQTYTVTVSNGCAVTQTTTLTPDVPTISACCNATIYPGNSTTLTASPIKKYQWLPNTGLNCDTCSAVIASPTVTTTYTVIGTDAMGCQTESVVIITVELPCADFIVPNVFTPNGDKVNDVLEITTQSLSSWSIIIYDRWGKEVFKSTNPYQYWDGNTENGGKAPDGVYYYIINSTCQGNTYKKNGFVQLIR